MSEGRTGIITRSFRILTNAGERKAYFEAAQARARASLECEQDKTAESAAKALRERHEGRAAELREGYVSQRAELLKEHAAEREAIKEDWRQRNKDRGLAYSALAAVSFHQDDELTAIFEEAAQNPASFVKKHQSEDGGLDQFLAELEQDYGGAQSPANDNEHDHDDDYEW